MIRLLSTRSGNNSAIAGDVLLHSKYDPRKEASRFLSSQDISGKSVFIILGPALGYLISEVLQAVPGSRVLPVFYSRECCRLAGYTSKAWYPDCGMTVQQYLSENIHDSDVSSLCLIEWPPSGQAFPEIPGPVRETVLQFLRERQGSILTERVFGRRWIKNSLRNFLQIDHYAAPGFLEKPILIAASGPSLEESFEKIQEVRENLSLWVLSSALEAFLERGIEPDFVVQTDPGFYASYHTRALLALRSRTPVIMPLSACPLPDPERATVQLISNGDFFEEDFLQMAGIRSFKVPSHGTVAGTALLLARRLTSAPVILAGIDFCTRDIRSHVRPHSFDVLSRDSGTRLVPEYSQNFSRSVTFYTERLNGHSRTSASMKTYAGWFASYTSAPGIFRLTDAGYPVPGLKILDHPAFRALCQKFSPGSGSKVTSVAAADRELRRGISGDLLREWQQNVAALDPAVLHTTSHSDADKGWRLIRFISGSGLDRARKTHPGYAGKNLNTLFEESREETLVFLRKLEADFQLSRRCSSV